jgi:hypothetical protein
MQVDGVVEQLGSKDVTTKWGTKKTYSIKVGSTWINCGFKDPKVATGDSISCEVENTTYGMNTKAVSITSKGGGGAATPSAMPVRTASVPSAKVFPVPALHGDRSIIRQNVLARATELFIAAHGNKQFELDLDNVSEIIVALARKFEAYATGDLDLAAAQTLIDKGE